ncbi:OmpA family protein [Pseudomonas sp. PCH446]
MAERLAKDIQAGRLTLHDEAAGVRLRLGAAAWFTPGGSVIAPGNEATLQRIAAVLADWPGTIRIIGHSDDTPVGKGRVSNQQLSLRRARAVLFAMFGETADPGRVQPWDVAPVSHGCRMTAWTTGPAIAGWKLCSNLP